MNTASESAFVQEELEQWATFLEERLKSQLMSRNINVSGALTRSVVAEAIGSSEVDLSFLRYGRFHDMGAGRGYHKGQFVGRATRGYRLKPPKPSKFYSRTAWGALTTLINNLQNKYHERIAADMKETLTDGEAA